MANFLIAYKRTNAFEGGYANDPNDAGGETYKGVARKKNPNWAGWKIIDSYKGKPNFEKLLNADVKLQQLVQQIYIDGYWTPIWGNDLKNQKVANDMYDTAVNMGPGMSIKLAQRQFHMKETSKMDKILLEKLNSVVG